MNHKLVRAVSIINKQIRLSSSRLTWCSILILLNNIILLLTIKYYFILYLYYIMLFYVILLNNIILHNIKYYSLNKISFCKFFQTLKFSWLHSVHSFCICVAVKQWLSSSYICFKLLFIKSIFTIKISVFVEIWLNHFLVWLVCKQYELKALCRIMCFRFSDTEKMIF